MCCWQILIRLLIMKKLLLLCAILVCTCSSLAQSDGTSMILEAYGQNRYDEMSSSNPGQIELLEKYALFGFHILPSNDKYASFPELIEIPMRSKNGTTVSIQEFLQAFDSGSFNPLVYGFFPQNDIQLFRLQGTNRVVFIDRQSTILEQ